MADSTLKDVIDRMKAEGQLTRNTGTNSIKSININISKLSESFSMGFGDFLDAQKSFMEKQSESLRRDKIKNSLADPSKPKNSNSLLSSSFKNLTESFKTLAKDLKAKVTKSWLKLLFAGLAGLALFAPEFFQEEIIDPIVDLFKVLKDPKHNPTTTLGTITKGVSDFFSFITDNFGETSSWVLGIGSLMLARSPLMRFIAWNGLKTAFGLLQSGFRSLNGLSGAPKSAGAAGGPMVNKARTGRVVGRGLLSPVLTALPGAPKSAGAAGGPMVNKARTGRVVGRGLLSPVLTAVSTFGTDLLAKAKSIGTATKDIVKNLGSMTGKAIKGGGSGLLRLGGVLLRFGPAGAVGLAIAGIAVAADKLRDMNIDSTVKDIGEKNAALKAAIESGNPEAVLEAEKAVRDAIAKVEHTTLLHAKSVQDQIIAAQNTLAEEAKKNLANALGGVQTNSLRDDDGSVRENTPAAIADIKRAFQDLVKAAIQTGKKDRQDQIKEKELKALTLINDLQKDLEDRKISPKDQSEILSRAISQILKVDASKGGIASGEFKSKISEFAATGDFNPEDLFKFINKMAKDRGQDLNPLPNIAPTAPAVTPNVVSTAPPVTGDKLAQIGNAASTASGNNTVVGKVGGDTYITNNYNNTTTGGNNYTLATGLNAQGDMIDYH
jgi:hypothetical protein